MDNFEDMFPENSVPVSGFRIVSYFKEDGTIGFNMSQSGDGDLTSLLGLLQMAQHRICTMGYNTRPRE